ncbi:MAG: hypothetical protein UT07_C0003G0011 [Parcubacteria group bacterium GW2011_GWB1_38_8]|uniref:Uncharacterized protein n=1 Tax=Candidatus Zambryskibacteria bacterium RIFCSPLOWO2_02_FULL_39_14 TaxID=1802769 RepID=A0A1G2UH86_9BACT|nr:MAG: hypothetical protein UT07_C0003G0011 [Parcubacteria group bacterium GW2011_GWB1_38_8]OHB08787.1 MAG: hypothetical protein A3I86_02035 [Candidatus Zambryskibacteria bacterium RIFCSPLOWO2_02_FULL_39_14]
MRKIYTILIIIISITLIAFLWWYLLLREKNIPTTEIIRDILPFGTGEDINIGTLPLGDIGSGSIETTSFDQFGIPIVNLFRISNTPVAGTLVLNRNNQTVVRYVDRGTGHIYDVALPSSASSTPLDKIKVTNNTLPKIYEAYFRPDGNAVLLRSLKGDSDVVENLSLTLTQPKSTSTLYTVSSTALRGDINSVTVGSGNTLFYSLRDTSSIVSSAFNGTGSRTLLNSPFNDWQLAIAGNNLFIHTKASSQASGYAYTLNTSGGTLKKILGPLNGLTIKPNASGSKVLYSYMNGNEIKLVAKNLSSQTLSEISPATLSEKCIWSIKNVDVFFCGVPYNKISNAEPENWYMGATHFSDNIWLFNTKTETKQVLVEPKTSLGIDIDVMEPKLSSDENYLIFINKNDLTLWAFRLP